MLSDDVKECPHCHAKDGYRYIIEAKFIQSQNFGNGDNDDDTGIDMNCGESYEGKHGACRCNACSRIIK